MELKDFYIGDIMEEKKNYWKLLQSKTVWILVAMFVMNGIEGIRESIPEGWLSAIDFALTLLAIYTGKIKPKVKI